MVVVDSSVWITSFRGKDAEIVARLRAMLDDGEVALAVPVRIELLSGASARDLPRLRRVLSALPLLRVEEATWQQIDRWIEQAVKAGDRFGLGDLLIAATAALHGCRVWSLDSDFARMAALGWIEIHTWETKRAV